MRRAWLAILLCLSTCMGGGGSSASFQLAPGMVVVYDGALHGSPGVFDTRYSMGILSATRDGTRIAVLTELSMSPVATWHPAAVGCSDCSSTVDSAGGSSNHHLFVSEDLGVTWRDLPISLKSTASVSVRPEAIILAGSHALVAASGVRVAGVATVGLRLLAEIDLTTGAQLANPRLDGQTFSGGFIAAVGGRVTGPAFSYDLATGVLDTHMVAVTTPGESPQFRSLDGLAFEGATWNVDSSALCWQHLDGIVMGAEPCIDLAVLPQEMHNGRIEPWPVAVTGRGVVALGSFAGYGYALPLAAPFAPSQIVALGAGVPVDGVWDTGIHPRWSGLVRLGLERFVDLPATGPAAQVHLRVNPCRDAAHCGSSAELQASLELDGGERLELYAINRHPTADGEQWMIAALRETPTRTALTDTVPVPKPNVVAYYPDATPYGPIDRACALAGLCMAKNGWQAGPGVVCSGLWDSMPPANPVRKAFLAANDCAAVLAAWPELGIVGKAPCTAATTCIGNVHVIGCAGAPAGGFAVSAAKDCKVLGATCTAQGCLAGGLAPSCANANIACSGNYVESCGRVEDCAFEGAVCTTAFGQAQCALPPCAAGLPARSCDGNVARLCPAGKPENRLDCDESNELCGGSPTNCQPSRIEPDCNEPNAVARGEVYVGDRYRVGCYKPGEMRVLDCASFSGLGGHCR